MSTASQSQGDSNMKKNKLEGRIIKFVLYECKFVLYAVLCPLRKMS